MSWISLSFLVIHALNYLSVISEFPLWSWIIAGELLWSFSGVMTFRFFTITQNSYAGFFSSGDTDTIIFVIIFVQIGFFLFLSFSVILLMVFWGFFSFPFPLSPVPLCCDCRGCWVGSFGFASIALCISISSFYIGLFGLTHSQWMALMGKNLLQPTWLDIYLILIYGEMLSVALGNGLICGVHSVLNSLLSPGGQEARWSSPDDRQQAPALENPVENHQAPRGVPKHEAGKHPQPQAYAEDMEAA